jgi:hypothetical protein
MLQHTPTFILIKGKNDLTPKWVLYLVEKGRVLRQIHNPTDYILQDAVELQAPVVELSAEELAQFSPATDVVQEEWEEWDVGCSDFSEEEEKYFHVRSQAKSLEYWKIVLYCKKESSLTAEAAFALHSFDNQNNVTDNVFCDGYKERIISALGGDKGKKVKKLLFSCSNVTNIILATLLWPLATPDHLQKVLQSARSVSERDGLGDCIDFTRNIKVPESLGDDEKEDSEKSKLLTGKVRTMMSYLGIDKVIRWAAKDSFSPTYLIDAAELFYDITVKHEHSLDLPRLRDLCELHDYLTKVYNSLIHQPVDLRVDLNVERLDGREIGIYKLEVPRVSTTLLEWGRKLDHCVGSYVNAVNEGRTSIVGVNDEKGEPIYTIQLIEGVELYRINQFYGAHNTEPPAEDKESISNYILDLLNK